MNCLKKVVLLVSAAVVVSCHDRGIVDGAAVRLVSPEKVVSVAPDTAFRCAFPEVLNCSGIQIVSDTVIVFRDQVSEGSPYCFKAYSTLSFNYLGGFIRNGRGPGEMIDPRIVRCASTEKSLILKASQTGQAYAVDVMESIRSGKAAITRNYTLPAGNMAWLPLPGQGQLQLQQENGESVFYAVRENGETTSFHPYRHIIGDNYVTYLSSLLANDGRTGKVAEAMLLFPQINIIDTESGQIRTVAVDRSYRQWERVLGRQFDMNTVEYYAGISPAPEYIIASYKGLPLGRLNEEGAGTSVHVFDWDGNFICNVKVAENIGDLAYDNRTGYLYCIDNIYGRILRYDLSGVLD